MKQVKKFLCVVLMFCMIVAGITIVPQNVQAATASGDDGEIHWEIKGDTLTLSAVKGTKGRMKNYKHNSSSPWEKSSKMKKVKNVVLKSGITKVGSYAFTEETSVNKMIICGTIKKIPTMFCCNTKIKKLVIKEGVKEIDEWSFLNSYIPSVVLPKSVSKINMYAFCGIGDGMSTYLAHVYGYKNSEAYKFTNKYNKFVKISENGNWVEEKGYEGIWDLCNDIEKITFHDLSKKSSSPKK